MIARRSTAAAFKAVAGGVVCVRDMVSGTFARNISADRTHRISGAGPVLCAPGPSPQRAGSRLIQVFALLSALLIGFLPGTAAAVPGGTVISNTAQADYTLDGGVDIRCSGISIIQQVEDFPGHGTL